MVQGIEKVADQEAIRHLPGLSHANIAAKNSLKNQFEFSCQVDFVLYGYTDAQVITKDIFFKIIMEYYFPPFVDRNTSIWEGKIRNSRMLIKKPLLQTLFL